jgi:hypothetical protein
LPFAFRFDRFLVCTRAKHGIELLDAVGSDPENFGRLKAVKSGVAPARFGVLPAVTFVCIPSLSPTLKRNCSRHRLKNLQKTELKHVVLTFFTPSL